MNFKMLNTHKVLFECLQCWALLWCQSLHTHQSTISIKVNPFLLGAWLFSPAKSFVPLRVGLPCKTQDIHLNLSII